MPEGLTGIILAGGASTRMGSDKAFLPWGNTTMIEHVLNTISPLVDEIIVAVDDALRFKSLGVRVVEDIVPGAHALGGIYSGLQAASFSRCFVCACDMPFLDKRLIRFLAEQDQSFEIVIPMTKQGLEPLHAVYARSVLSVIKKELQRGAWDVKALVSKVHSLIVRQEVISLYDPEELSSVNINTQEEYAKYCAYGDLPR